jgi:hypothetical protein
MRYLLMVLFLSACADGTKVAMREANDMDRRYGKACEQLGFTRGTEAFGNCLIRMSDRRR